MSKIYLSNQYIWKYKNIDRVVEELEISEGDAIYKSHKINSKKWIFKIICSVEIKEKIVDDKLVNLEIYVEEKQTGTLMLVCIRSLDGVGVVLGLVKKFYGTGRAVKAILNTTQDKTQIAFETTDNFLLKKKLISRIDQVLNKKTLVYQNHKLDFLLELVALVKLILNRHSIDLDYLIKNYEIRFFYHQLLENLLVKISALY